MPTSSLFLSVSTLQSLSPAHATNPAYDLGRVQLRDQLAWLHERIYPEMRARRWDLYYREGWSLSPAQVNARTPRIEAIQLRYTKAETTVRMMQKRFDAPALAWDELATLGVRVEARGLAVEFVIPANAPLDARNLRAKLQVGAPEKRALRQIFAELGGECMLILRDASAQAAQIRCSRLVDLGVLDSLFDKFAPGAHDLIAARWFAPDDPRLGGDKALTEILEQLTRLYALYQFGVWSPRNNFLPMHTQDQRRQEN